MERAHVVAIVAAQFIAAQRVNAVASDIASEDIVTEARAEIIKDAEELVTQCEERHRSGHAKRPRLETT